MRAGWSAHCRARFLTPGSPNPFGARPTGSGETTGTCGQWQSGPGPCTSIFRSRLLECQDLTTNCETQFPNPYPTAQAMDSTGYLSQLWLWGPQDGRNKKGKRSDSTAQPGVCTVAHDTRPWMAQNTLQGGRCPAGAPGTPSPANTQRAPCQGQVRAALAQSSLQSQAQVEQESRTPWATPEGAETHGCSKGLQ